MSNVNWGLLSTANINRRLIPAIRASARGSLVAVGSRSRDSAETYAAQWEIPIAYGSYDDLINSDTVDAVYIGLPNHLHAEWTVRALNAGKHVLCEKPFALSLHETDTMITAAERNGRVLMEAFMYRHHPQTAAIGEIVRSGRLGDITIVQGTFNFRMRTRNNIRLKPDLGGGSMWDVGVYPMSMAQFIYGAPPEAVSARQWVGPSGVDEQFVGQLQYSGGRLAQIACGFRMPLHTHLTVLGTDGRLECTRPFTNVNQPEADLWVIDAAGQRERIDVPAKELYLGQVENMHAAILEGAPLTVTLEETRNHVETVLALYASAESGGQRVLL